MTLRSGKTDFLNNIITRRRTAVLFYFNRQFSTYNNAAFLGYIEFKGLVLDYEL